MGGLRFIKRNFWFCFILLVTVALSLARLFVFSVYHVRGRSMNNTIYDGDRMFVWKSIHPSRKDIVLFNGPEGVLIKRCIGLPGERLQITRRNLYINDVLISEPERVTLSLDSTSNQSPYILDYYNKHWDLDNFGPVTIPQRSMLIALNKGNEDIYKHLIIKEMKLNGEKSWDNFLKRNKTYIFKKDYFFMLGDNRHNSDDSRAIGFISSDEIVGKSNFVLCSFNRSGRFFKAVN